MRLSLASAVGSASGLVVSGSVLAYPIVAVAFPVFGLAVSIAIYLATGTPATALAGYAAVVSTAAVFLTIAKELRDQADLAVTVWSEDPFQRGDPLVHVRRVNRGRRKVRVEAIGFGSGRFGWATSFGPWLGAPADASLPIELDETDSAERLAHVGKVAWAYLHRSPPQWLFVQDSLGGEIWLRLDARTQAVIRDAHAAQLERRRRGPLVGHGLERDPSGDSQTTDLSDPE